MISELHPFSFIAYASFLRIRSPCSACRMLCSRYHTPYQQRSSGRVREDASGTLGFCVNTYGSSFETCSDFYPYWPHPNHRQLCITQFVDSNAAVHLQNFAVVLTTSRFVAGSMNRYWEVVLVYRTNIHGFATISHFFLFSFGI